MDYSQFLAMKQEIGLLVVFLLVFLYDAFMPKKSQGALAGITTMLFFLLDMVGYTGSSSFAGLYATINADPFKYPVARFSALAYS